MQVQSLGWEDFPGGGNGNPTLVFLPGKSHEQRSFVAPLYVLASFVVDLLATSAWVYFWAFYSVPLIHVSVFVPVPHCFDYCKFTI